MLKKDPLDVRSANYATPGDVYLSTKAKMSEDNKIPEMMAQILQDSSYNERKVAVAEWNKVITFKISADLDLTKFCSRITDGRNEACPLSRWNSW